MVGENKSFGLYLMYLVVALSKNSRRRCSMIKLLLKIFQIQRNLTSFFDKVTGLRPATFYKNSLQMFSKEFCEILKNVFSIEQVRATSSVCCSLRTEKVIKQNPSTSIHFCKKFYIFISSHAQTFAF